MGVSMAVAFLRQSWWPILRGNWRFVPPMYARDDRRNNYWRCRWSLEAHNGDWWGGLQPQVCVCVCVRVWMAECMKLLDGIKDYYSRVCMVSCMCVFVYGWMNAQSYLMESKSTIHECV